MEVQLTLAFVDAPYFRKLFSPPLVEGSVGRLRAGTVQLEPNRGGSLWPLGTLRGLKKKAGKFVLKQLLLLPAAGSSMAALE